VRRTAPSEDTMAKHLTGTTKVLKDSDTHRARLPGLLLYGTLMLTAIPLFTPTGSHAALPSQTLTIGATLSPEISKRGAREQRFHEAQEALALEDFDRGRELLRLLAGQGYADAQFMLGIVYSTGVGTSQDMEQAAHWYQRAAEQGHMDAQYNLGVAYSMGAGVLADSVQAANWYYKAAQQGSTDAQFNLGLLYAQGDGVSKNMLEAAKWWLQAAAKGDAASQYALGLMFVRGDGVDQNIEEALKWWYLSASQGFERAQHALRELGIVVIQH
jgi:TPR repeat protein